MQASLFEDLDSEEPDRVDEQTGETILEERQSRRRRSAAESAFGLPKDLE